MEGMAFREYYVNEVLGENIATKNYSSYLSCFCNFEVEKGVESTELY
jgi:hypothetical protein